MIAVCLAFLLTSPTVTGVDAAITEGDWRAGIDFNAGHIGYDGPALRLVNGPGAIEWVTGPPPDEASGEAADRFELRLIYRPLDRGSRNAAVTVEHRSRTTTRLMNLRELPADGFSKAIGRYDLAPGETVRVRIEIRSGGAVEIGAVSWIGLGPESN